MFRDRVEQNLFFQSLYGQALRVAKRRYGNGSECFNYEDAVHDAIVYLHHRLVTGLTEFESPSHLTRYFWLTLRGKSAAIYSKKKEVSLSSAIGDTTMTLEDFVASRITYPSLEEEDDRGEIQKALNSLPKEQRELVYKVWIQGKALQDIKGNPRYLQRLLDDAKLKLCRKLIGKKNA